MSTTPSNHLGQFSAEISAHVSNVAPGVVALGRRHPFSGIVWRPGLVVTASEALDRHGDGDIEIHTTAGGATGQIVGRDPSTDIALIKVDGLAAVPLAFAAAPVVAAGAATIVVGRSGHGVSCAVGFVTLAGDAWTSMRGGRIDQRIRIGMRLESHQEGGPAVDAGGHVIGMAVLGPHRRTLVIPSATLERVAAELHAHGRIRRGYLGVAGQPVRVQRGTPGPGITAAGDEQAMGLMVQAVDAHGPAQAAGIMQGDIITALGDRPLRSPRQLRRMLGADTVGQQMSCTLIRAGGVHTLPVTIGEIAKP